MTLGEMKKRIVDKLYAFSAYQLPNICESIGLEPGEISEALQSKKRYVSNRIQGLNKQEIINVLRQLADRYEIKLIPEDNYSYIISSVTKKDIKNLITDGFDIVDFFDIKRALVSWHGSLTEIEFIKRICDINSIEVIDSRFHSFEEEYKYHREIAKDYKNDYFFESDRLPFKNSNSSTFLKIVCEMLHPEVRNEDGYWKELKEKIESYINADGFEFYVADRISGREVFGTRKITFLSEDEIVRTGIDRIAENIGTEYIRKQVKNLTNSLEDDSTVTIGKCKELVETACKYVLSELKEPFLETEDLTHLNKKVSKTLGLTIDEQNKNIEGAVQVLSGIVSIVTGLATLRNKYGDGHGKEKDYCGLPKRYGLLAMGCASTYINFLLDSYEHKMQ